MSNLLKSTFQLHNSIEGSEGYREYEEESGSGSHLQLVGPKADAPGGPAGMQGGVLGGHFKEKTLSRLKERFYWPGQSEDVKKWCQNCRSCAMKKTPAVTFCTDTQYSSLRQALVSRDSSVVVITAYR